MATQVWFGSAVAVQQVRTYTVGGTIAAGDTFNISVGAKTFTYTAGMSPTAVTTAAGIAAQLQSINTTLNPEFAQLSIGTTSGAATWTITGVAGVPFDIQAAPLASAAGTLTWSDTIPCSGPNFANVGANWSTGSSPASGDSVYLTNTTQSLLYGLDMHAIALASLTIEPTFTGTIGLPRNRGTAGNTSFAEYLPQYWAIGAASVNINYGGGRCKLDTGSGGTTLAISGSGTPAESGIKSILWIGSGSNSISISKGSFAAANFPGETAAIASLVQQWQTNPSSDSDVRLGSGCTVAAVSKTGGQLEVNCGVTSFVQSGAGTSTFVSGPQGSLAVYGNGSILYGEAGNYSSLSVGGGAVADFRRGGGAIVGTSTSLSGVYSLLDPGQRVTFTNPVTISNPDPSSVLSLGATYHLQRS